MDRAFEGRNRRPLLRSSTALSAFPTHPASGEPRPLHHGERRDLPSARERNRLSSTPAHPPNRHERRSAPATRKSFPSYRPHAITTCSMSDISAAATVESIAEGLGITEPGRLHRCSDRIQGCTHGSGSITIPGPPPYGVSSTLRCLSVANSRRSCTRISTIRLLEPSPPGTKLQRSAKYSREDRNDVNSHQSSSPGSRRPSGGVR